MDKFDIPEPKKIAPQLTAEQRQAMAPIDLLVQYIMPKLWDKVNYLEWAVKAEFHSVRQFIDGLQTHVDNLDIEVGSISCIKKRVDELEQGLANALDVNKRLLTIVHDGEHLPAPSEQKPKRGRKKKAEAEPARLVQEYDSEPMPVMVNVDVSEPVNMAAVAKYDAQADNWVPKIIDGTEITAEVVNAVMAGGASYSMDVMTFVYDLSESERKVLCAQFPDETVVD